MANWLIFAAWAEDDEALWNSHWIAQETALRAHLPPRIIEKAEAVRETLEAALGRAEISSMTSSTTIEGVALFAHGKPDAVLGSDDQPALDLRNVHLLERRWAHALACKTGRKLVPAALDADLFVGYDVPVTVDWTLADLPPDLRERVATLVTATTLALLRGVRSEAELRRGAEEAAQDVVAWVIDNAADYRSIQEMAQQLVERMVLSR